MYTCAISMARTFLPSPAGERGAGKRGFVKKSNIFQTHRRRFEDAMQDIVLPCTITQLQTRENAQGFSIVDLQVAV